MKRNFNKSNIIGNQPLQNIKIDPSQCPEVICTYCDCPTFVTISRVKAIPILMMPPQGGHVTLTTVHCSSCRMELDLETAKKWAHLSKEDREIARDSKNKADEQKKKKGLIP
jgi:hypothetical protein